MPQHISPAIKTLDDALGAVTELAPIARQYGRQAEDARNLPAEVVDAIAAAGLWGVFTPACAGGSGLIGLDEAFEIVRALAYADTSTAWSLFICATTPAILAAKLPADGLAEVLADGIGPMSLVFGPNGRSRPAEGGLRVTGRWPFASGIGYAGWVMANTVLLDEDGAPMPGAGGLPELISVRAVLPNRIGPPKFQPASEDPVIQRTVGRAQAAIRGARESTRAVFDTYVDRRLRGADMSQLSVADRCELHQQVVGAAETCRDAVDDLFRSAGRARFTRRARSSGSGATSPCSPSTSICATSSTRTRANSPSASTW